MNISQENRTKLVTKIGSEVAKLLPLKFGKDGRTNTSWGTKSTEGLGRCIERIVYEAQEKTPACKIVLQLMDKDYSYSEALKIALDLNFETSKAELETELNKYI